MHRKAGIAFSGAGVSMLAFSFDNGEIEWLCQSTAPQRM